MTIEISRYRLKLKRPVGLSNAERVGALVRIEGLGVADLHPWPELGDEGLETQLQSLAADTPTRLARQSLALARLDLGARRAKQSLFKGLEVPASHYLASPEEDLPTEVARDYPAVKFKIGGSDAETRRQAERLTELDRQLAGSSVRLRLDANARFGESAFVKWATALPETLRDRIDFVEDPFPSPAGSMPRWAELARKTGLRLALDRDLSLHLDSAPGPHDADTIADEPTVWIVKPARDDVERVVAHAHPGLKRLVFTHSLDHPVGQAAAAYFAARVASEHPLLTEVGGLKADVFADDAFTEQLASPGPRFRVPEGTGFGFDELLARLKWEKL